MNKVKMFFIAAALVLTTAGVFAAKAKFANTGLYASANGTTYYELASGSLFNLQTTGTSQAIITDQSGLPYGVYTSTGTSTYAPVFAVPAVW